VRELITIVEQELDERLFDSTDKSVKAEWRVETYRKSDGEILTKRDCASNDEAWEVANSFRRIAGDKTGIRIIDIVHTTVTTKKVRNVQ
jgi:hypothetical protein